MTPLAQAFTNDLLRPRAQRVWDDVAGLGTGISEFHFFEASGVHEAACDLASNMMERGVPRKLAFLPAPKTWIEYKAPDGTRTAVMLIANDQGDIAQMQFAQAHPGGTRPFTTRAVGFIGLQDQLRSLEHMQIVTDIAQDDISHAMVRRELFRTYALLAMINTPRVIGRRQHMPHRGLDRKLVAQRGVVGKFPLRAWTEIVLEVTPPRIDESEPREAHFTGAKALHFVRCHLRIQHGQLVLVSAHWRGDGALGIKQTRYRLEHPTSRAA